MEFSTCGFPASVQISEGLMNDVLKAVYETGYLPNVIQINVHENEMLKRFLPEVNLGCPTLKFHFSVPNRLSCRFSIPLTLFFKDLNGSKDRMTCSCNISVDIRKEKIKNLIYFVIDFRDPYKSEVELLDITFEGAKPDQHIIDMVKDVIAVHICNTLKKIGFAIPVSPFLDLIGYDSEFYATIDTSNKKRSYLSIFLKNNEVQTLPPNPHHPQQLWDLLPKQNGNCAACVTKELFFQYLSAGFQQAGIRINSPLPGCSNMNKTILNLWLYKVKLQNIILKNGPTFEFHDGYIRTTMKLEAELDYWWDPTIKVDVKFKPNFIRDNIIEFQILSLDADVSGSLGWLTAAMLALVTAGTSSLVYGVISVAITQALESILNGVIESNIEGSFQNSLPSIPFNNTFSTDAIYAYFDKTTKKITDVKISGKIVEIFSGGLAVRTNVSLY